MTSSRTFQKILPRFQTPPEWGIEPVPRANRVLGFMDYLVLWGDLGIGLLVMLGGTFLVPGLGLGPALLAILIGSAAGCFLLALVGMVGSATGVPTMVLLRPVLGVRGSYVPTVLNVLQLIGWTIFEFVVMGVAASTIARTLFGTGSYVVWAAVFAAIVILMGVGGPIGVVRQWLEKFAVWIALATGVWLTVLIFTKYDVGAMLRQAGDGSLPFGIGTDLAIAFPISWLPLVADYNRFARSSGRGFLGTMIGFFVTNAWFLALGAILLLGSKVAQEPRDFASAIALTAGWVALLILLADETHNAWADLYSSAVSIQNLFPKVKQRWLITALGAACFVVAVFVDITRYQNFLFVIGSFFVPLFGILIADYFVLRRRGYSVGEFYRAGGKYWYTGGVNIPALIVWALGVIAYHLANPGTLGAIFPAWQKLVPPALGIAGGSLPSFTVAFLLSIAFGFTWRKKNDGS
ncbi:MAG TPA: cytosine permease [Spirochaetia bacterium]|nr:cytosine permease [Spirochaetia bacterium]